MIVKIVDIMRSDKRKDDEFRSVKIKLNVVKSALGSCYFEMGKTAVIAATYGPQDVKPKHLEDAEKGIIMCNYNMLPFSVEGDRKRPGYDRRSVEISKVVKESLEPAIFLEEYAKYLINIDMQILQADAGTRVVAINAAALALACAGISMRDIVSAVAVGRANGKILVDLTKEEEDAEDAIDTPIAIMPKFGEITLLQMDGIASVDDMKKIIKQGEAACQKIAELQRNALKNGIHSI
ncbi:MAG: exosome complex exonuclease Rrp41 [Candidatus Nanohalarchaeota archaeon]|nr:MAG: exosome complex exonuclease Rrp41 [Candidatus Nanohaloarchaeota archaeon]